MENHFLNAVRARRTIYGLDNNVSLSNPQIVTIIEEAIKQAPAAFGIQPTRIAILFSAQHDKLWGFVDAQLKKIVSVELWENTRQKIQGFKAAYGTILFFEDQDVVKLMQNQFPAYANRFVDWSLQAQGIAVYSVWAALASAGIGASIQHYNPLIDQDVKTEWLFPEHWTLLGQMPFGRIVTPAPPKAAMDIRQYVKVIE